MCLPPQSSAPQMPFYHPCVKQREDGSAECHVPSVQNMRSTCSFCEAQWSWWPAVDISCSKSASAFQRRCSEGDERVEWMKDGVSGQRWHRKRQCLCSSKLWIESTVAPPKCLACLNNMQTVHPPAFWKLFSLVAALCVVHKVSFLPNLTYCQCVLQSSLKLLKNEHLSDLVDAKHEVQNPSPTTKMLLLSSVPSWKSLGAKMCWDECSLHKPWGLTLRTDRGFLMS